MAKKIQLLLAESEENLWHALQNGLLSDAQIEEGHAQEAYIIQQLQHSASDVIIASLPRTPSPLWHELCQQLREAQAVLMVIIPEKHSPKPNTRPLPPLFDDSPRESPSAVGDDLSARELEVLSYVARGMTNSEIAAVLHVSKNTVGFHLKNIFEKVNVSNRTEATLWYFTNQSSFS